MGLDMYLNAKRYVSKYFDPADEQRAKMIQEQFPEIANKQSAFGESPVKGIEIQAGYWRKANHIHQWFVKNIQKGEDDCDVYAVPRDKLIELRDTVKRVLEFKHLATDLLPPQKGFFFGGTEVGEWYWDDLALTMQILDDALAMPEQWDFTYQSSW